MASTDAAPVTTTDSPILRLPAELRELILRHVAADVSSKTPIVIWDNVYTTVFNWPRSTSTALLLTCQTFFSEALPLLYDSATLELVVCSNDPSSKPKNTIDLGEISTCELLKRFRKIELEISFNAYNEAVMSRVVERVKRLANALNEKARIMTLQISLQEANDQWSNRDALNSELMHSLLNEVGSIRTERVLGVHCNLSASRVMNAEQWQELRQRAEDYRADEEESFMGISFVYWNHRSEPSLGANTQ